MSRPNRVTQAANAVVNAAIQACQIRGVPVVRLNSGALPAIGAGGKFRPVAPTVWWNDLGERKTAGLPDLLLRPTILMTAQLFGASIGELPNLRVTVPLWVECKSGRGKLNADQEAFREHARQHHEFYLELHDSADELMAWFEKYQVTR